MEDQFPTDDAAALLLTTILPRACPSDMADAARFVRETLEARVGRLVAWETSRRDDGSLRGVVGVNEGHFEGELLVVADPDEPDHAWFADALDRLASPTESENLAALLDPRYPFARDELQARGFGIAKVHLEGEVDTALRRLGESAAPEGVSFAPASAADVDAITAARLRFFRRHAARCFGTQEIDEALFGRIEASQRSMVEASLSGEAQTLWVVRRLGDEEVVGSFGLAVEHDHPLSGSIAGTDLHLDDGWVGRGLSRAMYATMLRRAAELGVRRFRGTTWNPAVLHLAVPMQRWVTGWSLRKRGPYVEGIPAAFLGPEAVAACR